MSQTPQICGIVITTIASIAMLQWSLFSTSSSQKAFAPLTPDEKATQRICQTYQLIKAHQGYLTSPPNFHEWFHLMPDATEMQIFCALDDKEAWFVEETDAMSTARKVHDEPKEEGERDLDRQATFDLDHAIAYVLLYDREKGIYDNLFLPLLNVKDGWFKAADKWQKLEDENCQILKRR